MSQLWLRADDGEILLVEIVPSEDGDGFAARCVEHGWLPIHRSHGRENVIEEAGVHIDTVAHEQVPA